jgi:Xaa-Pro aminopeptidase
MSETQIDDPQAGDAEEMLCNLPRARAKMEAHGLDAIIGAGFINSYYLSGVRSLFNEWYFSEPYEAAILPCDPAKQPTFVTLTAVLPALVGGSPTWMPNVRLYDWLSIDKTTEAVDKGSDLNVAIERFLDERVSGDLENDIVSATVGALRQLGLTGGRIGFDDLRFAGFVRECLPDIEVVDAHAVFWDIRKVRTPPELRLLSYAARANQAALTAVIGEMRPGVNWRDLAYLYKDTWTRHGGRAVSDKGLLWGGRFKGGYIPDTFFMPDNDFTIEGGNYYILEGEGHVLQYNADASRTVFVGDPPSDYLKGVDAVMRAYEAIEPTLYPGRSSKDAYQAAMGVMEAEGVPHPGKTIVLTHGVGLEFVEWYGEFPTQRGIPESFELEAQLTIGMDCLYYGHTLGSFHFENGMVITEDGPRSFYAPPNTDAVLQRGLIVREGNGTECYCPSIALQQEAGVPAWMTRPEPPASVASWRPLSV